MKGLAVRPGQPKSAFLADLPKPSVGDIEDGKGVLVRVLSVGGCGTDLEVYQGEYGEAPAGEDFLVIGHENLGQVVEAGPNVPPALSPGTYVVATVRRPGSSIYDRIGLQDMTTDEEYRERGISLLHGYATEYYVESADFLVPLPPAL